MISRLLAVVALVCSLTACTGASSTNAQPTAQVEQPPPSPQVYDNPSEVPASRCWINIERQTPSSDASGQTAMIVATGSARCLDPGRWLWFVKIDTASGEFIRVSPEPVRIASDGSFEAPGPIITVTPPLTVVDMAMVSVNQADSDAISALPATGEPRFKMPESGVLEGQIHTIVLRAG